MDNRNEIATMVNNNQNMEVREILNAAYMNGGASAVRRLVDGAERQLNNDGIQNFMNNIQVERQNDGTVSKVVRTPLPFLPGVVLYDSRDLNGTKPATLNTIENFMAVTGILGGLEKRTSR